MTTPKVSTKTSQPTLKSPEGFGLEDRSYDIFGPDSVWGGLMKEALDRRSPQATTGQQSQSLDGIQAKPFNFDLASVLKTKNEHHAACLTAKTSATVGLGFDDPSREEEEERESTDFWGYRESKVDTVLNTVAIDSWQSTFTQTTMDFDEFDCAYMEVRYNRSGQITGLNWMPAQEVQIYLDSGQRKTHVVHTPTGGTEVHYPWVKEPIESWRNRTNQGSLVQPEQTNENGFYSKIIEFRNPSNASRFYGQPTWLSSVARIELGQALTQYRFDFFNNRGVPDYLLFLYGAMSPDDLAQLNATLNKTAGIGNAHRSAVHQIPGTKDTVGTEMHRLGLDQNDPDEFTKLNDTIGSSVVSAHRVPPLLAGIQIPGKLGASNEVINALTTFQLLVCGPRQQLLRQSLVQALTDIEIVTDAANPTGSIETLTEEDFTFETITDRIPLLNMDTASRMRSEVTADPERDLGAGVRE